MGSMDEREKRTLDTLTEIEAYLDEDTRLPLVKRREYCRTLREDVVNVLCLRGKGQETPKK